MGLLAAGYLLLLIIVSRLIARLSRSPLKWQFDPVTLFSSVWIIGYLVYALPIFTFRESITPEATLYVMCAHTVFFIGTLLGGLLSRESGSNNMASSAPLPGAADMADASQLSFRLLLIVSLVGLLGLASVFIDGLLTSSIGLGQRLDGGSLGAVRTETFARAAGLEAQGPLVRLNQFAAAAFLFVGLILNQQLSRFGRGKRALLIGIGWLSAVLIVLNQLLIRSGRMDIVVLFLFVLFAISLSPRSSARTRFLTIVRRYRFVVLLLTLPLLLGAIYYLGVIFVKGRSGGVSPLYSLYAYHRLGLTDLAESIITGSPLLQTAVLTLSYVVAPLTTHSFYFGLSDARFSEYFWGQYNFQYLTSFVMRYSGFGGDWKFFWAIRDVVWEPLRFLGYGTNVWATLLRDLAIDFGWGGTLFGMFLIGISTKLLALKAITGRYPALVVAYSFAAVFLMFSFAISMFYVTSVFPPFVYAMSLYIFLAWRKKSRPRPRKTFNLRPSAGSQ